MLPTRARSASHCNSVDFVGAPYFVENLIELLDAPNEWFHDEANQLLYYVANGSNPSALSFTATRLKQLIVIDADQVKHFLVFFFLSSLIDVCSRHRRSTSR